MKAAPFSYHCPSSVDELCALVAKLENAKLLAGGQSLVPMLNMRYVMPDHVVDLNEIPELAGIDDAGDRIRIGAMTRQKTLMGSAPVARHFPLVAEALALVGHFQTRNRGTIGGSLCHLDPSAELPCIAAAVDATMVVRGPAGERRVAMADWPLAYMTPNLGPDEVLAAVEFPKSAALGGQAYVEFARRHGDFAIIGVAALVSLDGARIARASLAVAGAGPRPLRLTETEATLAGESPTPETFAAAAADTAGIETIDDAYVSAAYRRRLMRVLVERALQKAVDRARRTG